MKNRCSRSWVAGTLEGSWSLPRGPHDRKELIIRTRLAQLLVVALALAALACAPERRSAAPGVMVITEAEQTASFIRNFNPFFEWGDVRWPARRAMYEPLMLYNVLSGEFVPCLGTSFRWGADNRSLEFQVREGVRWSDGRPFAARDVAYTFELLRRFPALDSRGIWKYLTRVTAPDERTVVFHLERPYVPLLEPVAQQPIVPEHVWSKVADPVSFTNANPVGTGPFTEVGAFQNQSYEVHRNPRYWRPGKPRVATLKFLAFPSNEQANLALISGDLDWAGSFVPAIDRIFVERDPAHHRYWFPPVEGMVFLYLNTARPPFDDVRVRKALSMAIDRRTVVKVAMHDYTEPGNATGLSDAYRRFRSPAAVAAGRPWVSHDPEGARALLDAAGLTPDADGQRCELTLIVPGGFSDWVRAAQVMAYGFRKIGVAAKVKIYDFNAWYEKLEHGEFEASIGWSEVHPSTYALYRTLMSTATVKPLGEASPENWHRFGSPAADALLAELERTTDDARERELSAQLQQLFVEHAPALPLFPGPLWGEYSSARIVGFPDADNPYAPLSPNWQQALLVLPELAPR